MSQRLRQRRAHRDTTFNRATDWAATPQAQHQTAVKWMVFFWTVQHGGGSVRLWMQTAGKQSVAIVARYELEQLQDAFSPDGLKGKPYPERTYAITLRNSTKRQLSPQDTSNAHQSSEEVYKHRYLMGQAHR